VESIANLTIGGEPPANHFTAVDAHFFWCCSGAGFGEALSTERVLHRGLCPRYASPGPGREEMHGSRGARHRERTGRRSELQQSDVLLYLVENGPGRSELELSEAIYGAPGYPQRLQQDLLRLVSSGGIERRGEGSPADPYIYHPIRSRRPV